MATHQGKNHNKNFSIYICNNLIQEYIIILLNCIDTSTSSHDSFLDIDHFLVQDHWLHPLSKAICSFGQRVKPVVLDWEMVHIKERIMRRILNNEEMVR